MSSQTPNRGLTKEDPGDDAGLSINAGNANLDILDTHTHPASDVTGTISPSQLGTGSDGSGDNILADDGTWVPTPTGGGASAAVDVTNTPAGSIAATNVQAAINELASEKAALVHTHAAADIVSGTIATARLGSGTASADTLLHGDQTYGGVNATTQITAGVVPTARLGSGSATSSTYLKGDQSWGTIVASDIGSGTVATARLGSGSATSSTLLHGDQTWGGVAAAEITSGTIATARHGSGTANSSSWLRGDSSWQQLAATDILTGTVATARLGSGTANLTSALFGDQTWKNLGVQTYVPVLTGGTSNPVLGTNGSAHGRYQIIGGMCHFFAGVRFGTAASSAGVGDYFVSLPVPAELTLSATGASAEMTSTVIGSALLWRGDTSLDLVGAHYPATIFIPPSTDGSFVGLAGSSWLYPTRLASDSGGATNNITATLGASVDLGDVICSFTGAGTRWKLFGSAQVDVDTVADRSVYLEIRDAASGGGASLGIRAESFADISGGLANFGGINVMTTTQVPTADKHYYLSCFSDAGGTFDVVEWNLEAIQQPGLGAVSNTAGSGAFTDYVGATTPWGWTAQSGQSEIWIFGSYVVD